jgi:hypothetical protein
MHRGQSYVPTMDPGSGCMYPLEFQVNYFRLENRDVCRDVGPSKKPSQLRVVHRIRLEIQVNYFGLDIETCVETWDPVGGQASCVGLSKSH